MASEVELTAYIAKLEKAAADPTKSVWYDDFKKENRPFSEIKEMLSWARAELRKVQGAPAKDRLHLLSARDGL